MNKPEDFNSDELPEELKGDILPEINPEKLFDENEYSTILIGKEGISKKDANNSELLTILISKKSTREDKDEALRELKDNNSQAFLINAITNTKNIEQKTSLIASCWETGLDFSNYFTFFIDLICDKEFLIAFESFTVIQEMNAVINPDLLNSSLNKLKECVHKNAIVNEAIQYIETILNSK